MTTDDSRRRAELLEESLAELLQWVMSQEVYDDQFDEETAWLPRLARHVRDDGLAPLAAVYDNSFVRPADMAAELESLSMMVERAKALLGDEKLEAALGRARLRRRLAQRAAEEQSQSGSPEARP